MKVEKDAVVRLAIEMVEGGAAGAAHEIQYLHGGYGNLFPKLEAALAGLEAGGKARLTPAPGGGCGEHDPSLIRREPRERLPQGVVLGSALHGQADEEGQRQVFRVTALRSPACSTRKVRASEADTSASCISPRWSWSAVTRAMRTVDSEPSASRTNSSV